MTKNQKGGKHKHMKKSPGNRKIDMNSIPTPADYGDAPVYIGLITSVLGGCRFKMRAMNYDNIQSSETIGWLRSSKCRGPRVVVGTVVLYALRDYESKSQEEMKGDIEYVYLPEEIALLKQLELIPHNYESAVDTSGGGVGEMTEDGFTFVQGGGEDVDMDEL